MSKKKFYIILIILTGIIIIGFLAWYFILKPAKNPAPEVNVNFTLPGQNSVESKIQAVSAGPIISAHQSDNAVLFYDFSGQLWQLSSGESKPILMGQTPIDNPAEIIWSKNNQNIVKSGTDQTDSFYVLADPDKKSLFKLKADTKSAAFSPDGKKIVYQLISGPGNNILLNVDTSGKNQKVLKIDLRLRDIILNWPNVNNIAMISRPSGIVAGSLWLLDVRNSNIRKIIDDLFGLEALFSPDGNSFIYSYTDQNDRNLKLAVYDKKGNQKVINDFSTLVEKCVWAKDSINVYCAAPESWPEFVILPDDYYKNTILINDDIWKINTETGEKTLIVKNLGNIFNIITGDENNLFFISKGNQFLYKLNMK